MMETGTLLHFKTWGMGLKVGDKMCVVTDGMKRESTIKSISDDGVEIESQVGPPLNRQQRRAQASRNAGWR